MNYVGTTRCVDNAIRQAFLVFDGAAGEALMVKQGDGGSSELLAFIEVGGLSGRRIQFDGSSTYYNGPAIQIDGPISDAPLLNPEGPE
jgi:hypothetical protein